MERPKTPEQILVEYRSSFSDGRIDHESEAGRKVKGSRSSSRSLVPLARLIPKWRLKQKSDGDSTEDRPANHWSSNAGYDQLSVGVGQEFSADDIDFIASLWRTIDRHIEDNPFLSEYNRTGEVFLRFAVDKDVQLDGKTFQASAVDRVLKVIAARALRKALKNETADIHRNQKRMIIHARFVWAGYETCQRLRGFKGNFLSFCHHAENKRKTFSTGEKVATYANAIFEHGPWAVEEIEKYNREQRHRKQGFDPFEGHKLDPDWNL